MFSGLVGLASREVNQRVYIPNLFAFQSALNGGPFYLRYSHIGAPA
ncbi:MAG: hypothetical protein WKF84_02745 [Pyrinomonadaceae bacterium]